MENSLSKEEKLKKIKSRINNAGSLHVIERKDAKHFEKKSELDGQGTIPIMTYGEYIVYLQAEHTSLPKISLSKFNYTSGTFEKKWGAHHKTIVLTPNHSCIRKVEIEIQGMHINKMKLLPDKTGDIFEDTAKVKITRHYRFLKGDSENKKDTTSASPGEKRSKQIVSTRPN